MKTKKVSEQPNAAVATPAASGASAVSAPVTPATPAVSNPEPIATWRRELTPLQQQVAELAADLIANGGRDSDVKPFLEALVRHYERRRINDPDEARVLRCASGWSENWYRDLVRVWPAEKPEADAPRPTAVADIIRYNLREEVAMYFDMFIRSTEGIEDLFIMREVLINHDAFGNELGEAFASFIRGSGAYVLVPRKHEERLLQFIRMLEDCTGAERKSAA